MKENTFCLGFIHPETKEVFLWWDKIHISMKRIPCVGELIKLCLCFKSDSKTGKKYSRNLDFTFKVVEVNHSVLCLPRWDSQTNPLDVMYVSIKVVPTTKVFAGTLRAVSRYYKENT